MEVKVNIDLVSRFAGSKTGLASALYYILRDKDDPVMYNLFANNAATERILSSQKEIELRAGAIGITKEEGMLKTTGELIERYCWSTHAPKIVFCSYNELKAKTRVPFNLIKMQLFCKAQYAIKGFRYVPFTKDTKVGWVAIYDKFSNKKYLPAQLLVVDYTKLPGEEKIGSCTTSGCAAANSRLQALLKGIYEQIERDAVMRMWFNKTSPVKVIIDDPVVEKFVQDYAAPARNLKYQLFNITSEFGIPTFFCMCIDSYNPAVNFVGGTACSLNPQEAAIKAITEAAQSRFLAKRLALTKKKINLKNIAGLEDNVRFYFDRKNFKYLEFLVKNKNYIKLSAIKNKSTDLKHDFEYIIAMLNKFKLTPMFLDITMPEVRAAGLYVMRAYIPELVQFSMPSYPTLANPRLRNAKNTMPHPFP